MQTAAVVKADAYGLGAARVARALAQAGARRFFVAMAEEGAAVRQALGPGPQIAVLSGHMAGDTEMIHDLDLTPMLNSLEQITRHLEALPGHPFGVQLDTGMNRLGVEALEWQAVAPILIEAGPGTADEPPRLRRRAGPSDERGAAGRVSRDDRRHRHSAQSLPRPAASCLGPRYHFDLTRPGIGLYGGLPYDGGAPGRHPVAAGDPDPRGRPGRNRRLRLHLDGRSAPA